MRSAKTLVILVVGMMVSLAVVGKAAPMGTAWTYQGRLMDDNNPGDGMYDFQFKLFNDPCAGTQQGIAIEVEDLDVIDGYFTAEVDFGSSVFNGNARWLEIDVRPGGSVDVNDFMTLSPRQEVTPTPYALQTRGIFVNDTGNIGIGTTDPHQRLHIMEGGIAFTDSVNPIDERLLSFGITGIGPDSRGYKFSWRNDDGSLRSEAMILDRTGDVYFMGGNVGIGTPSPLYDLHINDSSHAYVKTESASGYAFFMADGSNNSGLVMKENGTTKANVYWNTANDSLNLNEGGGDRLVVKEGNVGIGTANPQAKLHVEGGLQIGSEPNSVKIHGMVLLTGEGLHTGGTIYINLPEGYTSSNSMVVSAEVQDTFGYWRGMGYRPDTSLYYVLTTKIWIRVPETSFDNISSYRVLLMKFK